MNVRYGSKCYTVGLCKAHCSFSRAFPKVLQYPELQGRNYASLHSTSWVSQSFYIARRHSKLRTFLTDILLSQEAAAHYPMELLLCTFPAARARTCSWLDAEGASLIGTMRKFWSREAPSLWANTLLLLFERGRDGEDPAVAESRALGIAHLLPVLLMCTFSEHSSQCFTRASHCRGRCHRMQLHIPCLLWHHRIQPSRRMVRAGT